jgi:ataxia telangiectasia mutated family protein
VHTGTPEESTFKGKRAKREDPISTLLYFIRTTSAVGVRSYHLQVLLFFIDRHWSRLHDALQNDVISTLVQFVSVDEVSIQSWAFLCLAAIARCDGESYSASSSDDASMKDSDRRGFATWDPIWTHAMRRANAPVVCRAACHTAHTLIGYSKHLLTSQRALIEIETLVKDLDLQGPSFPYDAVCMFLAQCLRVASQDVRLYRMQLEEKVLSWLLDNWRVGMAAKDVSGRSHMPPHTISDYLNLLQSVCGYAQHSNPICRMLLPDCEIVDVMEEQRKTKPIRDYVLYAGLPALHQNRNSLADASLPQETPPPTTRIDQELLPPRGRERRVSAFLLKAMESLASEWGAVQENKVHPTAERVRQSLDAAITALFFESFLAMNGTQRNRRVVQSAGKVVMLLAPFLTDAKWTAEERLLILKALEPLVVDGDRNDDDEEWEALIGPGLESGIKSHVLRNVKMHVLHHGHVHIQCRHLQNFLWDNADVCSSSLSRRF